MNVFHCLLSVLPSLSFHRSTDRLESVWGFRTEPQSVAGMSAGILGWTFSVLWIVMGHSSAPALQFCQLALSGEIFSYFFFLYSFYLCCYFRGILGKPASEHIHQGHDESCLELFWPHVFVSPPKSPHVLLWCPQPEPQRPSRYHYLNMQSTLSFIPSEETILPRTEIPTTRKKRQFDIFLTVWKFLEPKKPFILHSGSYWIKAGGKKSIHSPYAAW